MKHFLTESEARTKWCPLSRVAFDLFRDTETINAVSANRDLTPTDKTHSRCIASDCMFWRGLHERIPYDGQNRDQNGAVIEYRDAGYCGAAGKPGVMR